MPACPRTCTKTETVLAIGLHPRKGAPLRASDRGAGLRVGTQAIHHRQTPLDPDPQRGRVDLRPAPASREAEEAAEEEAAGIEEDVEAADEVVEAEEAVVADEEAAVEEVDPAETGGESSDEVGEAPEESPEPSGDEA